MTVKDLKEELDKFDDKDTVVIQRSYLDKFIFEREIFVDKET